MNRPLPRQSGASPSIPTMQRTMPALGNILIFAGRPQEGIGLIEKAMRLNPRYPPFYLSWLGMAYRLTGQHEEAIAALKRALIRNPNYLPAHRELAVIYSELGQEAEARAATAEVLRI